MIKLKGVVYYESKRYYWFDILKIIAAFLALTNYTFGYLLEYAGYNNVSTFVYSFAITVSKIGVLIFLMVIGYFLLKKKGIDTYKSVLKKIIRVTILLLLVSLYEYIMKVGISNVDIKGFIFRIIEKPIIIPFWYLYMLIGLYLGVPLYKKW